MISCLTCGGSGCVRIPSSNPLHLQTKTCVDCGGRGLSPDHTCSPECDFNDKIHVRAIIAIERATAVQKENNRKLKEEIEVLKKEFDKKKAQLVTLSDQHWESAKDRIDDICAVRNKIVSGVPLTEEETRTAFFALSLVTGEARLRRAGY